ncbi:MAG: hypothetical protein ACI90V_004996, partial [Bacillariaceae sp.]
MGLKCDLIFAWPCGQSLLSNLCAVNNVNGKKYFY